MNRVAAAAMAAIALLAGSAAGWWLSHSREARAPHANGRKVLYWYDPMSPDRHFDAPGQSPYMNMQLLPKYADEAAGDGVKVGANMTQSLGIRLGKVEKTAVRRRLRAVGTIAFDERAARIIPARVGGYVTKLYVKAPLDRVRAGQRLAEITSPEWLEAEQQYAALLQTELNAAARERLRILDVPPAAIAEIERTGEIPAKTDIVAPIDGVVTELGVREGAAFAPGATLFRLNGLATVWADAQIPEANAAGVPIGSEVQARAIAWPGRAFEGKILALLPQVEAQTRTLTARVSLANPKNELSPGMFVTLDFTTPPGAPQLVIPSEALIETGKRTVVIVAREDSGFHVVPVTTGGEQEGRTIILSGLTEGQSIVLSGQFLIDSEASLRSAVNRLESAKPGHAGHQP